MCIGRPNSKCNQWRIDDGGVSKVYMARHLGVDSKIIDVVIERAKEVEKKFGV